MKNPKPIYAISYNVDNHGDIINLLDDSLDLSELEKDIVLINAGTGIIQIEIVNNLEFAKEAALISVDSITPELVGKAWEILIGLFFQINESVWISTYSQQYLSQYGKTQTVVLNGVEGVLIGPKGFDKMIS